MQGKWNLLWIWSITRLSSPHAFFSDIHFLVTGKQPHLSFRLHMERACTWRVCRLLWPFGYLWSRAPRDAHHHWLGHAGHSMPASSGLRQSHNQHLWHLNQGEKLLKHRYLCLKNGEIRRRIQFSSAQCLNTLVYRPRARSCFSVKQWVLCCYHWIIYVHTPPVRSGWEDGILSC